MICRNSRIRRLMLVEINKDRFGFNHQHELIVDLSCNLLDYINQY